MARRTRCLEFILVLRKGFGVAHVDRQDGSIVHPPGRTVKDGMGVKPAETELRSLILERFDPDEVEEELQTSLERRTLLKAANEANGPHWDYSPFFDVPRHYCR